jgi:putative spermidine/putrescine transport system ATP-binding protein
MSDRMAVFNHGKVEQVGTPREVYESPRNAFVAGFVGISNIIAGELARKLRGGAGAFTIRPEKITITSPDASGDPRDISVVGAVVEALYLGMFTRYRVDAEGTDLLVVSQNLDAGHRDADAMVGRMVKLFWSEASCRPLIGTTETGPVGIEPDEQPETNEPK